MNIHPRPKGGDGTLENWPVRQPHLYVKAIRRLTPARPRLEIVVVHQTHHVGTTHVKAHVAVVPDAEANYLPGRTFHLGSAVVRWTGRPGYGKVWIVSLCVRFLAFTRHQTSADRLPPTYQATPALPSHAHRSTWIRSGWTRELQQRNRYELGL